MPLDLDFERTLRSGERVFRLRVCLRSDSQRLVILGPSGSGKSLTLKAIGGLLGPDSGHIRVAGATLHDRAAAIDLTPQARRLAYLFQDYALFPHLNVRQNIAFGLTRGLFNPRPPSGTRGPITGWKCSASRGSRISCPATCRVARSSVPRWRAC